VLFFVDNIFRFTQAGSGSVGAARPYSFGGWVTSRRSRPTWRAGRSASPPRTRARVTSVQAIYVPADDLTDPAPATSFAHLDATTVLSRAISEKGHLIRRSTRSTPPRACFRRWSSARSTTTPRVRFNRSCNAYKSLQDIIAILGMDELVRRGQADGGARPQDRAFPVAAVLRRRSLHRLARQVRRSRGYHQGASAASAKASMTTLPEAAFYMVGTIEDAVEKGKKLAAEAA